MKFPAIALDTYHRLKSNPLFLAITEFVLRSVRTEKSAILRARFVHELINEYNEEIHANPLIEKYSPCKRGCSACCHTEVSVTPDEAELLAERVKNGLAIDFTRLHIQKSAVENGQSYYSVPYQLRACVFLGENNECRVYDDRPSVCRTNMVIGDAEQCSTNNKAMGQMRLIKTDKADMAIMGLFMLRPYENAILPGLLWEKLNSLTLKNPPKGKQIPKGAVFKKTEV